MQEGKRLSRRGFLETAGATAGALMTTGTFAHLAIGAVKEPAKSRLLASRRASARAVDSMR